MTAKRMTALLACLLLLGSLQAAVSQAQLYQKMRAAYGSLKTYQAELSQSNYYPQLKRTISYNGKIYFTPGRMLMSFSSPSVQRLQIRDGQVELYDASSKTLLRAPMQPEFGKMNPVEILDLYWQKSRVSVTSETARQASVSLKPKSDKLISSLSATLDKKSGLVTSLSYSDKSGNKVTYKFSGIKTNAAIPSSVWNFSYPKDVQVIEQ